MNYMSSEYYIIYILYIRFQSFVTIHRRQSKNCHEIDTCRTHHTLNIS